MNEEQLCDKINRISKQVLLISEDVNDFINSSHAEYEITTCPPSFEDFIKLSDTEMYRNKSNEEDCTIEEYNIAPKAKPKPNLQQLEKERIKKEVENLKNFKNKLNEEINQLLKKRELEKEESISKAEKKSASSSHELEQKKLNKEVEKLKNYKKELNEEVVQLLKAKTDAEKRKKGKKHVSKKINSETTHSDTNSLVEKFKPTRSRFSDDKISNFFEQFSVSECTDKELSSSKLSFGEIEDNLMKLMKLLSSSQFSDRQTNSDDTKFNHKENILTKSKPYQNKSPWYQHFIKTLSQNTVLSGNSDVNPNGLVEKLTNLCFGQECLDENIQSKKSKKNRKIKESISRQNSKISRKIEMKSAQRNKNQELLMEMFRELVQKCDVILEDIDEVNSKKSESLIETSSSRNSNSYYNQSLNNQLQNDCSYNVDIETAKKAKNKHYKTMSDASKESSYSFKERENYWLDKQRRK